jgi:hypothetical protein
VNNLVQPTIDQSIDSDNTDLDDEFTLPIEAYIDLTPRVISQQVFDFSVGGGESEVFED